MADLIETITYEAGIYQLERTDLVDAGVNGDGVANRQGSQLANRTAWLKQQVDSLDTRVTVLENTSSLSLSKALSIIAAFSFPAPAPSTLSFNEVAIRSRTLPDLGYFTPVSFGEIRQFYLEMNTFDSVFFPWLNRAYTTYITEYFPYVDWCIANSVTHLPQRRHELNIVLALADLGPTATNEEIEERAAEIEGVAPEAYVIEYNIFLNFLRTYP